MALGASGVNFAASFDTGDNSQWDSETDTGSLLDFPHYTTLAAVPGRPMPYRGAYCMRIAPGDTNDHTVTEGDIDVATGATGWCRWAMYISTDFAATANDEFSIFQWQQAGGTVEAHVALEITASTDAVVIGGADGAGDISSTAVTIPKGVWHIVETMLTVETTAGCSGDGVLDVYLNGARILNATSQTHGGAVGQGVLGTQDTAATTNAGYILFDDFVFSDTRYYPTSRFHTHRIVTSDSFLFVGPGRVDNVKIIDDGGGDNEMELYDTDVYSASLEPRWRGRTVTANTDVDAADVPIEFTRGCLVRFPAGGGGGRVVAGEFNIGRAVGWGSDGAIRNYAHNRKPTPGNV